MVKAQREHILVVEENIRTLRRHKHTGHRPMVRNIGRWKLVEERWAFAITYCFVVACQKGVWEISIDKRDDGISASSLSSIPSSGRYIS